MPIYIYIYIYTNHACSNKTKSTEIIELFVLYISEKVCESMNIDQQ